MKTKMCYTDFVYQKSRRQYMNNKKYPYNYVPEISDFKEFIDYCEKEYSDKTAFRWLEKR